MAKPFSLQLLLELTQDETDEATRKLGALIAEETGTRERLKLLEIIEMNTWKNFVRLKLKALLPKLGRTILPLLLA
jgi:flagellar biosynthesis chaperone FliJ